MDIIRSKNNLQIKEAKKLKERKYRSEKGKFLIEGFRFVEEALKSQFNVSIIFINENALDKWENYKSMKSICYQNNSKIYYLSDEAFKTISDTGNSQGIIAVVDDKKLEVENKIGFYVLADRVQDPGNMGTIIRSTHASGALGLIITKGTVDIYNSKTLRSTMGSIFHVPIIEDCNLDKVKFLRENGFKIVASVLDTEFNFYDVSLNDKIILAVGNEGNGLSSDIMNMSDIKVKIPMPGGAESLNASVAASIMMFEIVRQNSN
ncbi:RNA methyltransferase [Clostridium tyrobutyricum]|uniref:TrmH family RNA methyltransferase n=1 Tax=Clostridium tyrobutyricum TaxID=1519 RepID=UPI002B1F18D1|nr:RNA methyltransferase [Clostridium tyrobutyricum]MEA5008086.1 RNA methyltransferase [Clostridium tyrobutyricum]